MTWPLLAIALAACIFGAGVALGRCIAVGGAAKEHPIRSGEVVALYPYYRKTDERA